VNTGDGGFPQSTNGFQQGCQFHGEGVIPFVAVAGHLLKPIPIDALAKILPRGGEDHDAYRHIVVQGAHGIGQLHDHGFVDRIAAVCLVHPDDADLVSVFHQQGLVGHSYLPRERSGAGADFRAGRFDLICADPVGSTIFLRGAKSRKSVSSCQGNFLCSEKPEFLFTRDGANCYKGSPDRPRNPNDLFTAIGG